MTYGIKKLRLTVFILTNSLEFKPALSVNVSGYQPKEYKTFKGAFKKAERVGGVVFEISDKGVMNY